MRAFLIHMYRLEKFNEEKLFMKREKFLYFYFVISFYFSIILIISNVLIRLNTKKKVKKVFGCNKN